VTRLSKRASQLGESATLKVAARAGELKAAGVDVADFGAGEPDFESPDVAIRAAKQALDEGFTRYTAAAGTPRLRDALAADFNRRYGSTWERANVVVTAGAKGILFELALVLFDDGDEVVMPSPYWVTFPEQVRLAGAEPVMVPTRADDGFRIRAEAILAALTERTRAVIVNSPCNPTGGLLEAGDLEQIVAECARRGVLVIADETYERFVYDGRQHASAAALAARYPETVVVVGSFSKTYAMTGWRIGYGLGPPEVIRACIAVQSHSVSNPTSFAMVGALAALEEGEGEVAAMIDEYAARRELLMERLKAIPDLVCLPPGGAFYAFPQVSAFYRPGRQGSIEMSTYLLEEARVAVVPGIAFGADDYIRISFACSRATLEEGLDRLAAALRE